MNRQWIVVLRDGTTVDVTADDLLIENGIVRFFTVIEIPSPALHDLVFFGPGTWSRVQAVDAELVFHDPPQPPPEPPRLGIV